ncbi:MAG TPA: GDSL-type esterase/lipase family protein [Patescibacteria group bacterium]|nr:GDSL-type esterase/lipase family protein [Patescibacteria group bacterium]
MKIAVFAKNISSWIAKHSKLITPKRQPFIYVALGDSTVEGIGASSPEKTYAGLIHKHLLTIKKQTQFYNLGQAFATTQVVIHLQLSKALSLKPDLITISVGPNDLREKTSAKIFRYQLRTLLTTIKKQTSAEIIINTIPDFSMSKAIPRWQRTLSRVLIPRMNKIIKEEAKEVNAVVVDLYSASKIYWGNPDIISEDGFHPSDLGYTIWADTIIKEMKHLLE